MGMMGLAAGLSSCMVMRTSEDGYRPARAVVDGTAYEARLLAEGGGNGLALSAMVVAAGAVSVHGPYRFEVEAHGFPGRHLSFDVREVRLRAADGKTATLGRGQFGGSLLFEPGPWKGEVRAMRTARRLIPWEASEAGRVTAEADVTVRTREGRRDATARFVFVPVKETRMEAVNVADEIRKSVWKETREHPVTAWE